MCSSVNLPKNTYASQSIGHGHIYEVMFAGATFMQVNQLAKSLYAQVNQVVRATNLQVCKLLKDNSFS